MRRREAATCISLGSVAVERALPQRYPECPELYCTSGRLGSAADRASGEMHADVPRPDRDGVYARERFMVRLTVAGPDMQFSSSASTWIPAGRHVIPRRENSWSTHATRAAPMHVRCSCEARAMLG